MVTELALPEGGVSLEGSQLGDSQTALEIGGRHLVGKVVSRGMRHHPLLPGLVEGVSCCSVAP